MVIAFITLLGVFYPYIGKLFKRMSPSNILHVADEPTRTSVPLPLVTRIGQSLFALCMLLVMAYVVWEAKWGFGSWEPRAALFPWVVGVPTFLLTLYIFIKDSLQSTRELTVEEFHFENEPEVEPAVARRRTFAITCWIAGFFGAIWAFGFVPASAIATLLYLKFGAGERWPITLVIAAGCWLFFWGMFDYALQLPFPDGAVLDWVSLDRFSWRG